MVARIHGEADRVRLMREDVADRLARVISDIQLQLFGTPYTFVVGEACANHGVEFGDAA